MTEVALSGDETIMFAEAPGRVLREDVLADTDNPPADNSSMDGYAVRASDLPGKLKVIGDIPAGHLASQRVEPGTAMRIMTGAFVPDGADTVVQVELTDGGIEVVTIEKALPIGTNIRRRAEDIRAGDVVLAKGTRIGAAEMAMLASVQKRTLVVARKPTVAILSTGDELIGIDEPRRPGTIVNTNEALLETLVRAYGGAPQPMGIVKDTREATIEALDKASQCDFILTSGGVSVGAWDFVKEALEALGAETKFWKVAMKPGKPVVVSKLRQCLVFGLPGNPASCFVSFHLFVAPALRKAAGEEGQLFAPVVQMKLASPLKGVQDRRVYVRVRVEAQSGELVATPLTRQGSGALTSMLHANGLAMVEAGASAETSAPIVMIAMPR